MGSLTTLTNLLKNNVLTVVLLMVGVVIVSRSYKQDHRAAIQTVSIVLVGLLVIGIALTAGAPAAIGAFLVKLVVS